MNIQPGKLKKQRKSAQTAASTLGARLAAVVKFAFFLGIIAIFPIALNWMDPNLSSLAMGGTTILIVVSVALETVRTLESEMMMRHHKGFLE